MSNYDDERKYNQLLNQYNRLKANLESVSDEYENKTQQWQKKEVYFENLIKHARMLCEEILAKDKSEMTLGDEYSWSSIDTVDLLDKAFYSYNEYNKERTDLMSRLADLAEDRGETINALQDEIIYLKQHQKIGNLSNEEIQELAEKETNLQHQSKPEEKGNNRIEYITEENGDYDESDTESIKTIENINESYKEKSDTPLRSGRIFNRSEERIKNRMDAKREAIMTNTSNIEEVMNQIKETGWEILRIIGEYGICERKKITQKILSDKRIDTSESKLNITYKSLNCLGLITNDSIKLSLHPNICIHDLTSNGSKIFTVKFSKNPVLSERVKIIKEHDNEQHGYGIKELLDVLKEKKIYKELTMETRGKAIKVGGNGLYIPDIICTYNKMPVYFEFERGTHTPKDFELKLDKALLATKILNIVVPNIDIAETKIIPKIDKYLESKKTSSLKNVVIRVATIKSINNPNLKLLDNCDWQYVYDLNKGIGVKRNSMEA